MAYAAVISVESALDNLLLPRVPFSFYSPPPIYVARNELAILKLVLKRLDATSKGSSRMKVNALDAQIKDEIWRFQDLVESHLYDHILDPVVKLQELRHHIDRFVEMLKEKKEEYVSELDNLNLLPAQEEEEEEEEEEEQPPSDADSGGRKREFKMVGSSFDMLLEVIRRWVEFSRSPVDVVRVVGMAGIGKTAVAREFFDEPILLSELGMECRAWVSVGRKPRMIRTIKRDILIQLDPTASGRDEKIRERDVNRRLKGIFKAKRCLVVLDDVWDALVWYGLRYLFPNSGVRRNLVLITTRLRRVGDEISNGLSGSRLEVQLLDKDQSWYLLCQRVFKEEEEECPPQFIKAGQKIAEKCDGLPLMILAIAALLSEAEMTTEFWEEVAEKANHPIFVAAYDQLYEVLLPSYEYLPQHLKPCFLHMGVFPQYAEIRRTKLYWLWESEGFLEPLHAYLSELLDHTVIIPCRMRSFIYDIKTCRLHSTFWYLCRREATSIKFCRVLISRDDGLQQLTIKGQRRLSFHNNSLLAMKDVLDTVEEACASSTRSFYSYDLCHPYPVPICFRLRLLNVLDILYIRFYEFPEQVMQLVYLRYLSLTCNIALPPIISRLWNLQFLIIYGINIIKFSGETRYAPVEIWDMKLLKRIEIMAWNLPNPPPRDDNGASFLWILRTLTGVGAETCTREVFERIPNLTKLGILIQSSPNADEMEQVLDNLSNIHLLSELLSLKCIVMNPILVKGKDVVPPLSMFPSTLTKLSLGGMGYAWEYMSIIGSLPKLEVLKLRCYAFRGPKWVVRYGEFLALRYLLIEGTDLVHFEVEDRGLLRLHSFHLSNCYKLKRPLWGPDVASVITVFDCSPAVGTFALEMKSRYESHSQYIVQVHSSWEW